MIYFVQVNLRISKINIMHVMRNDFVFVF